MTLLHMDGFDHYATGTAGRTDMNEYGYLTSTFLDEQISSADTPFSNGRALQLLTGNRFVKKDLGANYTTLFAMAHVKVFTQFAQSHAFLTFWDSANGIQLTVGCNNTGRLVVWRGDVGGTQLAISTLAYVTLGSWDHIAAKIVFSQTVGTIDIQWNGVTIAEMSLTGLDTCATANTNARYVSLEADSAVGSDDITFDNWYIWDDAGSAPWNAFVGERRIETVFPDADTATEQWTTSSGSDSFAMVDEASPDDDTTYLTSSTPGNRTILDTQDLISTTGTCTAVAVACLSRKTDVDATEVAAGVVSSGVESQSPDFVLAATYAGFFHIAALNPNGSVAWTPTTAQASQLAIENRS